MGLSAAQGNYYFSAGGNVGPVPGAGPDDQAQPVQGTRRVDTVATYAGRPSESPSLADTHDAPLGTAWPPRGIYRARTPFWKGTQYVPPKAAGRISGLQDPPSDGPQRPAMHQMYATWSMWAGTDHDQYADDLSRDYPTVPGNARKPVLPQGQQDGTYIRIAGGQVGFYRTYQRASWDCGAAATASEAPVSVPQAQDQGTFVYGGRPHGLHTQNAPSGVDSLNTRLASPQMRATRIDRTSNSAYNGQSYSTTTVQQGQGARNVIKVAKTRRGVRPVGNG